MAISRRNIKVNSSKILTEELSSAAKVISEQISDLLACDKILEVEKLIKKNVNKTDKRITVVNIEGDVVADSHDEPKSMGNQLHFMEIASILKDGKNFCVCVRQNDLLKEDIMHFAYPLAVDVKGTYALRISQPIRDISMLSFGFIKANSNALLFIVITSMIIAYIFSNSITSKIINLKKSLVSNASHELKTPLASIKAYLEFLEEESNPQEQKKHIEVIGRNVKRLSNIVNNLLTLAEIESSEKLDLQDIMLKSLFEEMKSLFEDKANAKKISLVFKCSDDIVLKADRFRLEQVLSNLIDNALRYTEKGYIFVTAQKNKNVLNIEVKDSGIGINSKQIEKIFDRFYVIDKSRSRKTGGTGLGLSIAKHIVELHNGTIKAFSNHGKGSSFLIKFPLS
ncbi:MAG: HAMP domain-containing histidine kinase [Elusimicrobiota bacterium]|jgi:signal transduction histidine kinase|nr:HAMP domain-containing histidine kinase [Elusimicrobiota bacterium]